MEDDRSGKPDRLSPTGYSKMDYGRSWSSQEWKSEATAHDRSGKADEISWNAMQQVRLHHEELLISSCSLTNFNVMSNICFKVRSLEFMMEF